MDQGLNGPNGEVYIQPNKEQALSMLYLAAANNYGTAEYELAEHLSRDYKTGLSAAAKKHQMALVRQLYERAAENGVAQALLPLAYYNAMETNKKYKRLLLL